VRGLDDPANPYRGQYAEWDYYCFANARSMTRSDSKAWNRHKVPITRRLIQVNIDANGFPTPLMLTNRQRMEYYHNPQPAPATTGGGCTLSYTVYGDVPELLDERMYAAELAIRAEFVPKIPRWLAMNPPVKAIMLPGGDVATYGVLGSGRNIDLYTHFHHRINLFDYPCCHYSAAGELLAQVEPGDPWCRLFWSEAEQVLGAVDPEKMCYWEQNGFVIVQQIEGWKQVAIYNYDGAPLPVETNANSRDANTWDGWYGREIMIMYAAQQARNP
jgi:hypothetical protein